MLVVAAIKNKISAGWGWGPGKYLHMYRYSYEWNTTERKFGRNLSAEKSLYLALLFELASTSDPFVFMLWTLYSLPSCS